MRWTRGRHLTALLILPALVFAGALGAQVAPTLPRDTLYHKLPPESSVPRGVVAPTLPRDTLNAPLPPTANVPRMVIAPTLPRDTIGAGAASAPGAQRVDSIDPKSMPPSRPRDAVTLPPTETVRAAPVPTSPSPRRPRRQPLPQRRT